MSEGRGLLEQAIAELGGIVGREEALEIVRVSLDRVDRDDERGIHIIAFLETLLEVVAERYPESAADARRALESRAVGRT